MVLVELSSIDYDRIISWYSLLFGNPKDVKIKADIIDATLMRKLETMRDATILDEDCYRQMTKKKFF